MKKTLLVILLISAAPFAHAINKCVSAEGKTTYTDEPCPEKTTNQLAKTNPAQINASGSGVLSSAFTKQNNALKSGNWAAYLDSFSARQRAKVELSGEKMLPMIKAMIPLSTVVADETIAPTGDKGVLKVKGITISMISGKEETSYGTVELVKEAGAWKMDQQAWSNKEWTTTEAMRQESKAQQVTSCAGVNGKAESLPDQDMVKLMPGETQIAKFALEPNGKKDIRYQTKSAQMITFRVAHNKALSCKYEGKYPTGMSMDGGKQWIESYYAGQKPQPVNGAINLSFRNTAQETMNFLVVTDGR